MVREICLTSPCNLLVVEAWLGGKNISVLRDTRCNTVTIRKDLVPAKNFTGIVRLVLRLDTNIKFLPEANSEVKTPLFSGKHAVKCMQDALYDLVIGYIEGVLMSSSCLGMTFRPRTTRSPAHLTKDYEETL